MYQSKLPYVVVSEAVHGRCSPSSRLSVTGADKHLLYLGRDTDSGADVGIANSVLDTGCHSLSILLIEYNEPRAAVP